jgi:uncharacterized Zn-finger protein
MSVNSLLSPTLSDSNTHYTHATTLIIPSRTSTTTSPVSLSSSCSSSKLEPPSPLWDSDIIFPRSHSYPPPTSIIVLSRGNRTDTYDEIVKKEGHVACTKQGCGRKFKSRSHLIRHERMHTGEKPFGCPYASCLKRFSRRDNMVQHSSTHKLSLQEHAKISRDVLSLEEIPVRAEQAQ